MTSHHQQPPSPGGLHLHHGLHANHPPQVNGHMPMQQAHQKITPAHLASQNEIVWLGIGIYIIVLIEFA